MYRYPDTVEDATPSAPVIWLTGLPCAGKSTLGRNLVAALRQLGRPCALLDGDALRESVCRDLGFSPEDRDENVRRAAALAQLLSAQGLIVVVALVSPYAGGRDAARAQLDRFVEVFVSCPLEECERRDVKGMYAAARAGKVQEMTGVTAPYEAPLRPEVVVHTERESIETCVSQILAGAVFDDAETTGRECSA